MTTAAEEPYGFELTAQVQRALLLRTASMPGADYRVLSYYLTAAPLGQTVREVAKDVAEALGLNPGSVSKALGRLVRGRFLEVAYRVGAVNFYRAGAIVLELAEAGEDSEPPLATVTQLPVRPGE
jgi:hypothetical protein